MPDEQSHEYPTMQFPPEIIRKQIFPLGEVERTPPSVGIFDSPTRCYIVNKEWAEHIMGMVHLLADVVSWKDAQDESYFAIKEVLRFMQGMECMDFELRQSPDDNCILQQTTDGGDTWTDVFDFSLCATIQDGASQSSIITNYYNTLQNYQNNVYNDYFNNYAGDITNIHPELGFGDSDDAARNNALCNALDALIAGICDSANKFFDEQTNAANDLKTSLALAGAILGIIALAASGVGTPAAIILAGDVALWAAGVGIGAALGATLYDHWQETNQAAYNDEDAKDELLCCLYDAMQGSNPDQTALISALESCAGSLSTEAAAIANAGAIMMAEIALYAAFTENMAIGFQSAKLGLLPGCACEEAPTPEIIAPCFGGGAGGTSLTHISGTTWSIQTTHRTTPDEAWTIRAVGDAVFRLANINHVAGFPLLPIAAGWKLEDNTCGAALIASAPSLATTNLKEWGYTWSNGTGVHTTEFDMIAPP